MPRAFRLSLRSARFIVALLLGVKLLLLVWNAAVFDGQTYAATYHSDRALSGGLVPRKIAEDPPLYYLPALLLPRFSEPRVAVRSVQYGDSLDHETLPKARKLRPSKAERALRDRLLDGLRYSNVLWLAAFYVVWIYLVFPKLCAGAAGWFAASLLLLSVPGYQKLGAMSHPDNALAATLAVAIAAWLAGRSSWTTSQDLGAATLARKMLSVCALPVAILLVVLSRKPSVLPLTVLTVLAVVSAVRRSSASKSRRFTLVGLALLPALFATVWPALRARHHEPAPAAPVVSTASGAAHERVAHARYLRTLHLDALIETPSEQLSDGLTETVGLPTLAFSDTWGDHWLAFSGQQGDDKVWPKRMSLMAATPLLALVPALLLFSLYRIMNDARRSYLEQRGGIAARLQGVAREYERELALTAVLCAYAGTYLAWHFKELSLAGADWTLRFIHFAPFLPLAIALLFSRRLHPAISAMICGYFLALFGAAFAVAMYWPA